MKIIFLDVDGVLNIMSESYNTFMKPYSQHIEPHLIQRLNYIIEQTDAHVVISSSWRATMDDLKLQMEEQGFKYWDKVLGRTPHDDEMKDCTFEEAWMRGNQIKQWIKDNNFSGNYIVLEDEISDVCGSKCSAIPQFYVVEVDIKEGLQHKDVKFAILKLNEGLELHKKILAQAEKDINDTPSK